MRINQSDASDILYWKDNFSWKFPKLNNNMMGKLLRPIVYTDGSPGLNAVASRSLHLVSSMSILLNFTFDVIYGDGWISVGGPHNNSLGGVGKLLQDSAGDFLCQTHELSIERAERLDFVFPTVTHREEAFFQQPSSIYENIILSPFTKQLQLSLALMAGVLTLTIWIMLSCTPFKQQNRHGFLCNDPYRCERKSYNKKYHMFHCLRSFKNAGEALMWVLALFAQQGWQSENLNDNCSLQIVSIAGLWLTLVSNLLYSAKILSIVKSRSGPITSFEELLYSGMDIFVDSDAPNVVRMSKKFMKTKNNRFVDKRTLSADNGLAKILSIPNTAFISYAFYVENAAKKLGEHVYYETYCHLVTSVSPNPRGLQVYNGMYVRKNSSLRPALRYSLIRIKESGLMASVLQSEYTRSRKAKCSIVAQNVESLPFPVVAPCFSLLTLLMLVSLLVLLVECFKKYL